MIKKLKNYKGIACPKGTQEKWVKNDSECQPWFEPTNCIKTIFYLKYHVYIYLFFY